MPDCDDKKIPTLDDIIDDESPDKSASDSDIGETGTGESDIGGFFDVSADSDDVTLTESIKDNLPDNEQPDNSDNDNDKKDEATDEVTFIEPVLIEPILIEPIVDAITKQIMPELEQQLKRLIQEALEEQLPEHVISPALKPNNDDEL